MPNPRIVPVLMGIGFLLALQGCVGMSPPVMIARNDQVGLMKYYEYEAKELREKARTWDSWAESYERHSQPNGKTEAPQRAAHCRAVAGHYRKAAEEVEALAVSHRRLMSQDGGRTPSVAARP